MREKDKKIELVFENGKLVENNIIPIEAYELGDTLYLDVYYSQKSVQIKGIIRENKGKKVRLEIVSFGTNKKWIIEKIVEGIIKEKDNSWVNPRFDYILSYCDRIKDIDDFWVNPRYCKRKE